MKAILFTAYYCGKCNTIWDEVMQPLVDEGYRIKRIDAMLNPSYVLKYNITAIPTVIVTDCAGNIVKKITDTVSQEIMREALNGL